MSGKRSEENFKRSKPHKDSTHAREMIFSTAPRLIPLAFKIGLVYLSFKRKAKKAGKIFEKELISAGIDKDVAKLLTEDYLKSSHFLREFDFSDMMRKR